MSKKRVIIAVACSLVFCVLVFAFIFFLAYVNRINTIPVDVSYLRNYSFANTLQGEEDDCRHLDLDDTDGSVVVVSRTFFGYEVILYDGNKATRLFKTERVKAISKKGESIFLLRDSTIFKTDLRGSSQIVFAENVSKFSRFGGDFLLVSDGEVKLIAGNDLSLLQIEDHTFSDYLVSGEKILLIETSGERWLLNSDLQIIKKWDSKAEFDDSLNYSYSLLEEKPFLCEEGIIAHSTDGMLFYPYDGSEPKTLFIIPKEPGTFYRIAVNETNKEWLVSLCALDISLWKKSNHPYTGIWKIDKKELNVKKLSQNDCSEIYVISESDILCVTREGNSFVLNLYD